MSSFQEKILDSDECFLEIARYYSQIEGTALLYSGGTLDSSKHSFLFVYPIESFSITDVKDCNPWDLLREQITFKKDGLPIPEWIGYLSYEMGAFSDQDKQTPFHPPNIPYSIFNRYSLKFVFNHASKRLKIFGEWEESRAAQKLSSGDKVNILKRGDPYLFYKEKIEKAIDLIFSGDIYQVNLSQQWLFKGNIDPFFLFDRVNTLNPAPFSAFLNYRDFQVVSSSPERFLECKNGLLETRPIKGTIARGKDLSEDEENKRCLLSSEKDLSELLMITDLMRNDLGKVSKVGSVQTTEIVRCEKYANVFHLLSVIRSKMRDSLHPVEVVKSCFPGGSITGCPKIRSMEVINQLENRSRGIYTGSIGYFSENGDFDFNIAIRTLLIKEKIIDLQLGGAIVCDSSPISEYQETLDKGKTLLHLLKRN